MQYASTDDILMFMMVIIYIIYVVYQLINYLLFQEMIILYHFIQIIIILIVYSMVFYKYYNKTMEFDSCIIYCIVFCIVVLCFIDVSQLALVSFVVHLYVTVDTIYIHLKAIFTITTIFINDIVCMMELNDCDCRSYYRFIYRHFISSIHLLMIFLSTTVSKLLCYDANQ